jgi:coenzyme F420-reducing hydrogenase delta subunit
MGKANLENQSRRLVAFCCERSGMLAWQQAESDCAFPANIKVISVPCAGRLGMVQLLKAFEEGAEWVAVFACVEDSCQSLRGNLHAKKRAEAVRELLGKVGIDPERLGFCFIAPPGGEKFKETILAMMEKAVSQEANG